MSDSALYSILAAKTGRTRREIIMTFWSKLTNEEREIMRLRYYKELTYSDIMREFSHSREYIRVSIQSALDKFKKYPLKGERDA